MRPMSEAPRDPMRAAQANMRPAAIRRYYKTVDVRAAASGQHVLMLDGRSARTPGRNPLSAKSRALMLEVAAEWKRQRDTVEPADMPLTRLLHSAVDGVSRTMAETRADFLKYAGSDLLCYRAEEPEELAERQRLAFDPVLAWAAERLGARFILGAGVVHVDQPTESIEAARSAIADFDDPVALAALSAMTTLSGSALLALAVARGRLSPQAAWRAAHVDEDFQAERWGVDADARVRREARWREFEAAALALEGRAE
jgi:chaperone required for assembly of F1-ATPase